MSCTDLSVEVQSALKSIISNSNVFETFLNGSVDDTIMTASGISETLAKIVRDKIANQFMLKVVDFDSKTTMESAITMGNTGLFNGVLARVHSDVNPANNGIYQLIDEVSRTWNKVSYQDILAITNIVQKPDGNISKRVLDFTNISDSVPTTNYITYFQIPVSAAPVTNVFKIKVISQDTISLASSYQEFTVHIISAGGASLGVNITEDVKNNFGGGIDGVDLIVTTASSGGYHNVGLQAQSRAGVLDFFDLTVEGKASMVFTQTPTDINPF